MFRRLRIVVLACLLAASALAVAGIGVYWAVGRPPAFYREALAIDPRDGRLASDELLEHATALANDARREGQWSALFTTRQVNGWLAVDLVENHRESIPAGVGDLRTKVDDGTIRLACRYEQGRLSTVLSLVIEPYLVESNVLALRIRGAQVGLVPLPLRTVLDAISRAAHDADLRLRWQKSAGDPVALIEIPPITSQDVRIELDHLEVRGDALYLAGHSSSTATIAQTEDAARGASIVADQSSSETRQR